MQKWTALTVLTSIIAKIPPVRELSLTARMAPVYRVTGHAMVITTVRITQMKMRLFARTGQQTALQACSSASLMEATEGACHYLGDVTEIETAQMAPTSITARIRPVQARTLLARVDAVYFVSGDVTEMRIAPTALTKRAAKVRCVLRQSLPARTVSVYRVNIRATVTATAPMARMKMRSLARTERRAALQTCFPAGPRTAMSAVCR